MSMDYKYTNISVEDNNFKLEESDKIHPCLLKNNYNDIKRALEFLNSDNKFLYIHGFLGTGKRQFVNYICEYLSKDVVKLEYYCKEATVCDDILLYFTNLLEESSTTKTLKFNAKITTLSTKFQTMIESIKKPILIILHSADNVCQENLNHISSTFSQALKDANVKIIVTTCSLKTGLMGDIEEDKTIFLKAFTMDIFKEFLQMNKVTASDRQMEDFYELTRGYYFYTALSVKLMQSLNIPLVEFMQKIKNSGITLDKFIGESYINSVPVAIRNFFWFLRAIRHGISLNALAILEIYDEFSIQYLKANLIAFQVGDTLYLHDYFAQRTEIILPAHTEIKLHKYIIGIYEKQLKETLVDRAILISRQAMRTEIEYHKNRIYEIENNGEKTSDTPSNSDAGLTADAKSSSEENKIAEVSMHKILEEANKLAEEDKITEAIEKYKLILENNDINTTNLVEIRLQLAKLYSSIEDYQRALHYYELTEAHYKNNKELINLNYLYYDMTKLFYKMYKPERAVETIKKVIYSADTPQSLFVNACTLLGNIYSDMNSPDNAYSYYRKAIDSIDENIDDSVLAELYFKYALANDDRGEINLAFEYYNRCISITHNNNYIAPAYSNLAACYYENNNIDDALNCYMKAYNIEKNLNNYDGIYYASSHIGEILNKRRSKKALKYLTEAKQSAEFVNEPFYITSASIALGDYYYNLPDKSKDALIEYLKAINTARNSAEDIDTSNIIKRIEDMKFRMPEDDYAETLKKYGN